MESWVKSYNENIISLQKKYFGEGDYREVSYERFIKYIKAVPDVANQFSVYIKAAEDFESLIINPFKLEKLRMPFTLFMETISVESNEGGDRVSLNQKIWNGDIIFSDCSIGEIRYRNAGLIYQKFYNFKVCCNSKIGNFIVSPMRRNEQRPKLFFTDTLIDWVIFENLGENQIHPYMDFNRCSFAKGADCINGPILGKLMFKDCKFAIDCKADVARNSFNNAIFEDTTQFIGCTFYRSPKFHNSQLHSDTTFSGCKFVDYKSNGCADDYRVLKQKTHEVGDEISSMMFHACEMDARRKTRLSKWKIPFVEEYIVHPVDWLSWFHSYFLKVFNDYGRNFWLPWVWFFGLIPWFITIYHWSGGISCNLGELKKFDMWVQKACEVDNTFLMNFAFTLQHIFGPIGLVFNQNAFQAITIWTHAFSIFQVLIYTIFWYLIIVQIRRQFRL